MNGADLSGRIAFAGCSQTEVDAFDDILTGEHGIQWDTDLT